MSCPLHSQLLSAECQIDVVLIWTIRCLFVMGDTSACPLHSELHSAEYEDDLTLYCSWPPDACSWGGYICLSTNQSSSLKVVSWCSNTLEWKDMSELVWSGKSPHSISIHLMQEYVMRSCSYTTENSH